MVERPWTPGPWHAFQFRNEPKVAQVVDDWEGPLAHIHIDPPLTGYGAAGNTLLPREHAIYRVQDAQLMAYAPEMAELFLKHYAQHKKGLRAILDCDLCAMARKLGDIK